MDVALKNYERRREGLHRAMSEGWFKGDEFEREEPFQRVEQATRKHTEVLTGLLDKVPEQARSHIAHAIEVSQGGRATALANLERARAQRQKRQASEGRQGSGRPEDLGRSGSRGRPGGLGDPPASGRGGPPGTPGAGRSAGRTRGPG